MTGEQVRLHRLLAGGSVGVAMGDDQGHIIQANDVFLKMIGYTRVELIAGRIGWNELTPPEYHALDDDALCQLNELGYYMPYEKQYIGKDGHRIDVLAGGTAIEKARLHMAYIIDITEHQQAKQSIRHHCDRFQTILGGITNISFSLDPQWRLIDLNTHAERFFGRPRRELLGQLFWELYPAATKTELYKQYQTSATQRGKSFSGDASAIPPLRWFEGHAYPSNGELVVYFVDITDRKRAELALVESETHFRQLADAIPQILWAAQPGGHIDYFNRQWFEFTGLPEGQAGKASWRQALHREDRRRCLKMWHESLRTGQAFQIEYRLQDRAGSYHWHLGRAYPVQDKEGRIVRWFGCCTDIDELKRTHDMLLEQSRQLTEADKRKDEFLAMLAHELRNPLASIHYALQTSCGNGAQEPFSRRQRDAIAQQVNTMTRLVNDLLDVSRISRGKVKLQKERVDFRAVVDQIVESFRPLIREHRHAFTYTKASQPLWLNADAIRLEQVVRNLLSNAVKYTAAGGRIAVTVGREAGSDAKAPRMAVVRVKDSGMGIAPEMISRIFDLFTQAEQSMARAQGGLGIGLTVVRNLVEMHGGSVEALSEGVGQGSEFVVRLPMIQVPEAEANKSKIQRQRADVAHRQSTAQAGSRRVMVVDDNEDLATFLRELLELWGHAVCVAHDGPSAVERALAFQPEVALLDIGLPGMNGYQLARLMRTQPALKETMLVALTGYGQDDDRDQAEQAGFNRHLTKPVELDTLRALLA